MAFLVYNQFAALDPFACYSYLVKIKARLADSDRF
jgi:hypothetical protein